MKTKGKISPTVVLDILGLLLILGGAYLARFAIAEPMAIVGGILTAIGIGLLSMARWYTP